MCRREGMKLFLKGPRCGTDRCAFARRAFAPGQHGKRRVKLSNYGIQLREKQKVKRMYGILERQFRRYFENAARKKGVTGELLLQELECRLDNVVFRSGFATSRTQARQIVRHGSIRINGKRVNIPSYSINKDEIIAVKNNDKIKKYVTSNTEFTQERSVPDWIAVDKKALTVKVVRLPQRTDIVAPIKEQLIVELYSK